MRGKVNIPPETMLSQLCACRSAWLKPRALYARVGSYRAAQQAMPDPSKPQPFPHSRQRSHEKVMKVQRSPKGVEVVRNQVEYVLPLKAKLPPKGSSVDPLRRRCYVAKSRVAYIRSRLTASSLHKPLTLNEPSSLTRDRSRLFPIRGS